MKDGKTSFRLILMLLVVALSISCNNAVNYGEEFNGNGMRTSCVTNTSTSKAIEFTVRLKHLGPQGIGFKEDYNETIVIKLNPGQQKCWKGGSNDLFFVEIVGAMFIE